MNEYLASLKFHKPSFPSTRDRVYDNFEKFDAYPVQMTPMYFYDAETGLYVDCEMIQLKREKPFFI